MWAIAPLRGTFAQRAEIIALTEALRRTNEKRMIICTDSRYAFATAYVH
jgi:ribonuclease HI